jgi:branched-chain amino acid transport system permease protein
MSTIFDVKANPKKAYTSFAVLGLVLVLFPFVAANFGNSWVRIIDFALLYIMLALGLKYCGRLCWLLDLGYIAFYAVGAYLAALSVHHSLRLFWRLLLKIIRHSGIFW